jgi:hypothetical protein
MMISQSTGYLLQSLGLVLDIVGAILLFKFGLPEMERTGGQEKIVTNKFDEAAVAKEERYDRFGKLGLVSLIMGFLFQLLPNICSWWNS